MPQSSIVIYEAENGQTHIEVKFDRDSLWLSLLQIAELFERDKSSTERLSLTLESLETTPEFGFPP